MHQSPTQDRLLNGPFTQEDPIGIAGGLNLYGYAGGDPINFSDPFGLCPEEDQDDDGKCPGGLSVGQWDAAMEAAARVVEMSESKDTRPEYGMFVLGDGAGQGTLLPVVYGGGSSSRVVGTPWYPGGLPWQNPDMAVAMVHSHPDRPNGEGGLTYVSLAASDGDLENARRRQLPMFIASHRGVRLYLPSGLPYPKIFDPPGSQRMRWQSMVSALSVLALGCAGADERVTARDAVAFGYRELNCQGLGFDRVLADTASFHVPGQACTAIREALEAARDRGSVSHQALDADSVPVVIVRRQRFVVTNFSPDSTGFMITFDLRHRPINLVVEFLGDSLLDLAGAPKGLRYQIPGARGVPESRSRCPNRPFTQEDPIGIAGGLNLYGYAGGDPINFSDPFGLEPCDEKEPCESFIDRFVDFLSERLSFDFTVGPVSSGTGGGVSGEFGVPSVGASGSILLLGNSDGDVHANLSLFMGKHLGITIHGDDENVNGVSLNLGLSTPNLPVTVSLEVPPTPGGAPHPSSVPIQADVTLVRAGRPDRSPGVFPLRRQVLLEWIRYQL